MDDDRRGDMHGGCPHVNRNDVRCGSRLSLGRLDQAFCVCFGAFYACPMYQQINAELAEAQRSPAAAHGRQLVQPAVDGLGLAVRATGT